MCFSIFQAFSQFERDLIVQRTKEGIESASLGLEEEKVSVQE
nr:hypothetical protein [Bacillus cereus]